MSSAVTSLAKALWLWALERDILLTAQHILWVSNAVADLESRLERDRLDWMLAHEVFQRINQMFGPLEVDLFATRLTHQLPHFYSLRLDPLAEAVDAFKTELEQGERLCQAPMVPGRMSPQPSTSSGSSGNLVTPVWKGQA